MNQNNSLSRDNKITIRELAKIKIVSSDTIKRAIRRIYPKKLKNGVETLLNEEEVSNILEDIDKNRYLSNSAQVQTELQENEMIIKSIQILATRNKKLELENDKLFEKIKQLEPKAKFYDDYSKVKNGMSVSDCAKLFGVGSQKLFKFLREEKILFYNSNKNNVPYQNFIDCKYFELKVKYQNGYQNMVTAVMPRGFKWLDNKYFNKVGIKNYIQGINK